ncbi:MAG: hypothetical protein JNJ46_25915 [Myxococcales bacterium]|nr:hypothetical protein [Myxococcales bacterium]
MRERLCVLGLLGLLATGTAADAHEEGPTPPVAEGAGAAPARVQPAKPAPGAKTPGAATTRPAPQAGPGKAGPTRPLRLTLEEKDRHPPAAPVDNATKAEAAPPGARPAPPAPGEAGQPAVVKPGAPLKLAPSAKEIENERKTVLKPPVENRPDRYENQRPDIPSPTQVRRVPGPGSSVGSTGAERKATMIEHSGPQQNTTYRRW